MSKAQQLMEEITSPIPNFRGRTTGTQPAWFVACRKKAREDAIALGLPTKENEEWKYTTLPSWVASAQTPSLLDMNALTLKFIESLGIKPHDVYHFVWMNGSFVPLASVGLDTIKGLTWSPLSQLGTGEDLTLKDALSSYSNGVEAMNTALVSDGLILTLKPGVVLDKPLLFLHIASSHQDHTTHTTHHVLRLSKGSSCRVIEHFVSMQDKAYITNHRETITLEKDASLSLVTIQEESQEAIHCHATVVHCDEHAVFNHMQLSLGSGIARKEVSVFLEGKGAETTMNGVFLGRSNQHLDHALPVYHLAPGCKSHQHYKSVMDEAASGVFYGHIFVEKGADATVSSQRNKNLLLSPKSMCYSRPELDINTDDVQCSHGSATGALDPLQLSYLRSRGIGYDDAMRLLLTGFIYEVVDEMPEGLERSLITRSLDSWLSAFDHKA